MEVIDTIQLHLPADLEQIRLVSTCVSQLLTHVKRLPEPEVAAYNIQLAAQEICVNIVTHAYAGVSNGTIQVTLTLLKQPNQLVIELRDTGQPFQPEAVPLPNLEEAEEHGYGLFLVRELLDDVHYEHRNGVNYWRLTKYLQGAL